MPAPPLSGTSMLVSVSAEPPRSPSDTRSSRCSRAPSAADTLPRRRELGAVPLAVVERERVALVAARARNAERGCGIEPAREQHHGTRHIYESFEAGARFTLPPRHVAPQHLVQLDLQPHRQPVREYPVREIARGHLLVARREEHGARRPPAAKRSASNERAHS